MAASALVVRRDCRVQRNRTRRRWLSRLRNPNAIRAASLISRLVPSVSAFGDAGLEEAKDRSRATRRRRPARAGWLRADSSCRPKREREWRLGAGTVLALV